MFEIAVAVAEETRPWEGRVFSVCIVGVTLHSNRGFWLERSGYCTQIADFEVCLYVCTQIADRVQGGRRPHGISSQVAVGEG
jgi:hypothetical protein